MASVPLTLTDLFGDQPHEEIVEDVYGDGIEMLIGHLDPDQITDRLSRQAWWQPGMAIDPDSIDHAWVTFDEHTAACDAPDGAIPGRGCDCSWSPWILYHWRDAHPTDPDAVAVTFVELAEPATTTAPTFNPGVAA